MSFNIYFFVSFYCVMIKINIYDHTIEIEILFRKKKKKIAKG